MSALALPFMQTALLVGLFAGNALALIGVFVLARGVAFSGLAASQLAALGSVVGIALGLHFGGHALALVLVCLGLLFFDRLRRRVPGSADGWLASLYVLGAAFSVLVLSKSPHGESHTLSVFFGNLLALGGEHVAESLLLLVATLLVLLPALRRWIWVFFDPLVAAASGIRVQRWIAGFLVLFAGAMTLSIHLFGVLLAFSFLLLPGTVGLLLSKRSKHLFLIIPAMTSSSILVGLLLSFHLDFPSGPFIAGLLAAGVLLAGLFSSR